MDSFKTRVIFRKWITGSGGVIAFFPDLKDGNYVMAYEHVGQHGNASFPHPDTEPASPEEYAALAAELTSIGYNLRIEREEPDHGKQQAKAQYESIQELVAALDCDYDRLEELTDERADLLREVEDTTKAYAEATEDQRTDGELGDEVKDAEKALAEWIEEYGEEFTELSNAATIDGDTQKDAEAARERISEDPLEVSVRSGWTSLGQELEAEEFYILLCTGGPACRIRGELNGNKEPSRAWLEYQDWGTPWTEYLGENVKGEWHGVDSDVLLTYCQQFFFGE